MYTEAFPTPDRVIACHSLDKEHPIIGFVFLIPDTSFYAAAVEVLLIPTGHFPSVNRAEVPHEIDHFFNHEIWPNKGWLDKILLPVLGSQQLITLC